MKTEIYRIKDICSIKSGKRIPLGMDFTTEKTNHPYIRARDIKNGTISTDELVYLDENVYRKIKKYIINNGDIAITIVGASVGDTAYANSTVDGYNLTENAVRLTSFDKKANSKYVFYQLLQKQYRDYMQTIAGAAAQPKLGIYKVERIRIALPDRATQDKIVGIIDAYDNLISENAKRIKVLEQMAENLYKEWFVRFHFPGHETAEFENGIPKGWKTLPLLGWLKDSFNGGWGEDNCSTYAPFIAHVIRGTDIEEIKKSKYFDIPCRFHKRKDIETKQLHENDIVLELSNGNINNIGRTLFVGNDILSHFEHVMCASFCKTLRFENQFIAFYVWKYIEYLQNSGLMFFYKNTGSNGINNFNFKRFLRMPITIPNEYTYIAPLYDYYKQASYIREMNYNLVQQRDLLLPRLMSGKMAVKILV